ncbi:MAG TPA: hypothetical protein VFI11_09515, partial [Anaerolineales bacterium]|nr:hypothetical protein [Anaerolineales bacterium]
RWRHAVSILAWWIVPPLVIGGAFIASGLVEVLRLGMCPPAPPDIAAYPCTASDYILRMSLGPWALVGHITIFSVWGAVLAGVLLVRALRR